MIKAALHFLSISDASVSGDEADAQAKTSSQQLVSIALFSGIGLFVSLLAVLLGIQGAWF
jgi:hypothetical protein